MVEFTKVGLVYHPGTRKIVRIVYPVEGDYELDNMADYLSALDATVAWKYKIVARDDPSVGFGVVTK